MKHTKITDNDTDTQKLKRKIFWVTYSKKKP